MSLDITLHPRQTDAYQSAATEILYGGAAGGGKSYAMRALAILWCAQIAGLQVYIFRRTYDDLIKNHIEGPKGFLALLADWQAAGHCKIVEGEIRFFNGSKIYLCHCEHDKHRYKYQGAEIHVLLIDELTLFTETIYRFLRTRVRMTSITLPDDLKGRFPRILCGSNPGNIGHAWVKSTFITDGDSKVEPMQIRQMPDDEGGMLRQYIPATLDDNPTMAEDDPSYRTRIRGMGNAALVCAFELGDWDAVVGSYLEGVWDADKHVIKPFAIPSTWAVWRAMDWGYAKPYCVLWAAMDFDGVVYIWRELYGYGGKSDVGSREEASAVARKIKEIEQHDEIAALGCIACHLDGRYNPVVSLHHIDGRTKPDAHKKVLPLCACHHQHDDTDPAGRIGVHPYKARFEAMYGKQDELLRMCLDKLQGVCA